ncbi:MAG: lysophospholipid acyltransferase family protein [Opitutaceae bacterium]|nr:lysophospholipid acyltransferase family protein [Opitutaceae bacterium]
MAWSAVESLFVSEAGRACWLQRVCRRARCVLEVKVRVTGAAPRGAVIAANHLGYLDILVLASLAPCVFVAKHEVRAWPVFGWFARRAGTRFVDRERRADVARVAQEFAPVIAAGENLVLFLEGTSTDGRTMRPFKSALLEPAARAGWPAVPAAIMYAVPPPHAAEHDVCWWGEMTLAPHLIGLAGLPRIDAAVAWGTPAAPAADRKGLARALHDAVRDLRRDRADDTVQALLPGKEPQCVVTP